jgi:DNA-binding winged helix-turn-helix (wHTH) protein
MAGGDDFAIARREVLLRRIGHETLLQSGDSASRVLPVERIAENDYRIRFEKDLSFQPGFLVNTIQRLLAQDPTAGDYVVNVLNCGDASVAYGFAISKNKMDDIIPCKGRRQPRACYMIDIKFKPAGINTAKNGYLLGGLTFLALAGFIFFRSVRPQKALPGLPDRSGSPELSDSPDLPETAHTDLFTLGSIVFDMKDQKLVVNGNTTDLTGTESRILRIFALSPNEAIERSRLQKEIWEDQGVIVGRSLDMFISKLRKKLEPDPKIRIVVIRGKGYKLEISSSLNC